MTTAKKASFQVNWVQEPQFSKWLDKVPNDKYSAKCKLCQKTFSLSNMGRRAVSSHKNSSKHAQLEDVTSKITPMMSFFKSSSPAQVENPALPQNCDEQRNTTEVIAKHCTTLDRFKLRDEVTEAEILWCVNTVMNHNSLRKSENSVSLFSRMFPDSQIAKDMKLHKDKISYSIVYGLANYFGEQLRTAISTNLNYVVGFDESLNKIAEKTQMDLSIRYWDDNTSSVKARYLGSVFLTQGKATDLLEAFKTGTQGLDLSKILQISMDGPNVNWCFYKLLKSEIGFGPESSKLLELGSCGLHVVHGAFKTGITKTGWNIIQFLRALFNLFKMSPTRRGNFTEITGCKLFPLSFCTVRWIENSRVAKRALEVLPALEKYVETVKGTDKEPACNSFKVIESSLLDKLLPAKLAFFESFAEQLEPFLTEFQTDSPMVPFLYDSLLQLLKQIMTRFVSKENMEKEDFFLTDVVEKKEGLFKNLSKAKEIDLGYGTRSALRQCTGVKDKDILGLRKEIRTCLQHFTIKIQERSPLKYPLTKSLSFLNPEKIPSNEEKTLEKMSKTLDLFIQANIVSPAIAERADREFREVISKERFKFKCENYKRKDNRLDEFWTEEIGQAENLKQVVVKILLLSHGNATVERGFSVNKEMMVENLREESLIGQRIVYDAVINSGGMDGFSSQPIPKKLIHSMRNSYSRYKEAENHRKQTMSEKDRRAAEKRKSTMKVKELEAKKSKLLEEALKKAEALAEEIENLKKQS